MRIGILADIHDCVTPLRRAVQLLRAAHVDQVVTLGDAFDSLRRDEPAAEVARILAGEGAVGVWGNHDLGLSHDVTGHVRGIADAGVLEFAARLSPQLVLGDHRFSHVLPWRDACVIEDLWAFDDLRDGVEPGRCFEAVRERVLFVGHYHSWGIVNGGGEIGWRGVGPVALSPPSRYLVLIAAVRDGWCAHYDTETAVLTPLRCHEKKPAVLAS